MKATGHPHAGQNTRHGRACPGHPRLYCGNSAKTCIRATRRATTKENGFTLVEVIVALSILSGGLGILLGVISDSLRQTAGAARLAEAGSLAQSLMAEVGTILPVKQDERTGEFPNGYRWHLKIDPYGDATEREEWPVGAYVISAQVEWQEGTRQRVYALTTMRLGARALRQ